MPFFLQEIDEANSPKVFTGGKFLKGFPCVSPYFQAVAQIKRNGSQEAAEGDHACCQNPLNCFSTTSIGRGRISTKRERIQEKERTGGSDPCFFLKTRLALIAVFTNSLHSETKYREYAVAERYCKTYFVMFSLKAKLW